MPRNIVPANENLSELVKRGLVTFDAGTLVLLVVTAAPDGDGTGLVYSQPERIEVSALVGMTQAGYDKVTASADPNADTRKKIRALLDAGKSRDEVLAILTQEAAKVKPTSETPETIPETTPNQDGGTTPQGSDTEGRPTTPTEPEGNSRRTRTAA